MEIVSREAAQQIVDTVKDVCSQNINFIDEKGLSEDALCRVVIRVNSAMPSSYTVLCGWKISRNHKNDGQVIKKISQKVLDF